MSAVPAQELGRISAELRAELLSLGTATLYEASGIDCFLPPRLRPVWEGAEIAGRALPVRTRVADNLPLHRAVAAAETGDVLVVDARGSSHGYWGEVLAVAAQQRGVAGLVIDGGVRDTAALKSLGFPVFSAHVAIEGTLKDEWGTVGEPIRLGSAPVSRGDVIVADCDGVVAIPQSALRTVLDAARERTAKEEHYLARIRGGALTMDLYGLSRSRSVRDENLGGAR